MSNSGQRAMRASVPSRSKQGGAVLYVALIMLILLALMGIVGMQVTGMQERMSANYRSVNVAFQRAEDGARGTECYVESVVNRTTTTCAPVPISQLCDEPFDAAGWAADATADATNVRSIGQCISGESSLAVGKAPVTENPNPVFQITAFRVDDALNASANAAIDTIYRP